MIRSAPRLRLFLLAALFALFAPTSAPGAPAPGAPAVDRGAEAPAGPPSRTIQRGPVTVTVELTPEAPVIGDELRLQLVALAEDGVELLMPEFGEALDRFRIIDFAQRDSVDEAGRTRAVQSYTLASPMSGEHRVPPLLVEFVDRRPGERPAPEGEDAYEILTERLDFQVASVLPEGALPELPLPPGELALEGAGGRGRLIALGAGILLLAIVPFALLAWQRRRVLARRQSASEIAEARLAALLARGHPDGAEQVDAFYVELSGIVRTYLENRFDLRSPELTTEEFFEAARQSPDLTPELQVLLKGFLERADLVKFARHVPGEAEIESAIGSVRRVLESTRELSAEQPTGPPLPAEGAGV